MGVLQSNQALKTNFAAVNDALTLDVANLSSVRFEISGVYNFTLVFESLGMDGSTWFPMQVVTVNSNTVATSHSTANATQAYEASCNTVSKVRVRVSAFTSAGAHSVGIAGSSAEIEPAPVAQIAGTVPVSGSTTATPVTGTAYALTTAATTNGALIITGAKRLAELSISNPTATAAFVKLYNKATAPTVGTDVPVKTIPIAATGNANGLDDKEINFGALGKQFPLGIGIAVTGLAAATDTTATVAGIQIHGTYL